MKIRLAYSPDTDDAFMVYALRQNLVDCAEFEFEFVSEDIQTLNEAAKNGVYDITAISVAAYPHIATEYEIMPCGASVGQRFGPVIVVSEASPLANIEELANKRIAVPGMQTTAMYAAACLLPQFKPVAMPFFAIRDALLSGDCEAGILIHELQLNYHEHGLRRIDDLGRLWHAKYQLPLPLGTNAIRRSLGRETIARLNELYTASIRWALSHRDETLTHASAAAMAGLRTDLAERYISMYVNDDSLIISPEILQAMRLLFDMGYQHGLCPQVADLT